jgi:hypothetical protein
VTLLNADNWSVSMSYKIQKMVKFSFSEKFILVVYLNMFCVFVNCAALVAGWDMAFVLDALFKLFGTCLTTSLSLSNCSKL